jgi:hypothetical protein
MDYTITKVETDKITVTYADKSWAVIPLVKGLLKEELQTLIATFAPKEYESSVSDIPLKEGDTGNTTTDQAVAAPKYGYQQVREIHYPTIGNQLDAMYWARQGDDTKQKAYDVYINEIKTKIPKDEKEYTEEEAKKALD